MPRHKRDDIAFVNAAAQLWDAEHDIGYVARVFAQTSLPYQDPGAIEAWGRRNGNLSLVIQPGVTLDRDCRPVSLGYPYGTVPRLLLTWVATEAVRTKERDLVLGESLADFMRQLDLVPTGGKMGTITRLRKQMERLFLARFMFRDDGHPDRDAGAQLAVAAKYDLWWTSRGDPNHPALLPSYVRLTEEFFEEVTTRPVPISVDVLRLLRGSPMRLDIYCWLTYRMSYLRRRGEISWDALRFQFGSNFADTKQGRQHFRRDFERHLMQVLAVYKDANVETAPGGLVLLPSRTHIARRSVKGSSSRPH